MSPSVFKRLAVAAVFATFFGFQNNTQADEQAKTRFLYCIRKDNRRTIEIHVFDLKTNKDKALLAKKDHVYLPIAVSPSGKTFVAFVEKSGVKETLVYSTETGKELEKQPFKGKYLANYITETRLVALEDLSDENVLIKQRLIVVDIDGKNEKIIKESRGPTWDDIPLSITPDKKQVCYYNRGENRGLIRVNLETGKTTAFPEKTTLVSFSPDSKQWLLFNKKKTEMELHAIGESGTTEKIRGFGKSSLIGRWIQSKQLLYYKLDPKKRSLELRLHREGAPEIVISSSAVFGEDGLNPLHGFDYDPVKKTVVWVEMSRSRPGTFSLWKGVVGNKKIEKTKELKQYKDLIAQVFMLP